MDITTATPVEIDTELAALYAVEYQKRSRAEAHFKEIQSWVGRQIHGKGFRSPAARPVEVTEYLAQVEAKDRRSYDDDQILRMWENYQVNDEAADEAVKAQEPYNAEFTRRGGWTRAFLVVTSGRGHVHSSMACSTTYATTQFHWLPTYSGSSEDQIVSDAGERACTICYPSAPVEIRDQPTKIFSEDEQRRAQERAEREAAKAAREAAKIVVPNWQERKTFKDRVFKTQRGLTNELSSILSSLVWYGETHPTAIEWAWNLQEGRKVAEKGGWDYDKALDAQRKKAKREGGQPKF